MGNSEYTLCPICEKVVKKQGLGTHKRKVHRITKQSQKNFIEQVLEAFGDLGDFFPAEGKKKK
jgi:hypothetical protein